MNVHGAKRVKEMTWEGYTQLAISRHLLVRQSLVKRIVDGVDWTDLPWPDGSTGALSPKMKERFRRQRKRERYDEAMHFIGRGSE